jgi:hypothetical protein
MDAQKFLKPRYGLTYDPCWSKYYQWPWEHFPIQLPACAVHLHQEQADPGSASVVRWQIERGVAIVARLARPDGKILAEVLPECPTGEGLAPAGREYLVHEASFSDYELDGLLGIGFEWVFEVPVKPAGSFQPWHPLGAVRVDGSELLGKVTTLTVNAGGWSQPSPELSSTEDAQYAAQ